MRTQPTNLRTNERSETTRPVYVYIINHGGTLIHLTSYDDALSIAGLPATHGTNPQTFASAQVSHSAVDQRAELNAHNIQMTVGLGDNAFATQLKGLILTAIPSRTTVIIARMNPSSLTSLDWSADAFVVFKGIMVNTAFNRYAVQLDLVSLLMQNEGKVPRVFYQKTCQHNLYDDRCGVNPEAANNKLSTTLATVSPRAKFVEIADTTINGNAITATTFQAGYLTISGQKVGIVSTTLLAGGAGVRIYLAWWDTNLTASASVAVYRGCRRVVDDCNTIFSNQANFGGFPYIPVINPAVNSIRASENN